jgi:hypothetical protein
MTSSIPEHALRYRLNALYVCLREHMDSLGGRRVTFGGRAAAVGDDGRLCPVGRLIWTSLRSAEAADVHRHGAYHRYVDTPLTRVVDRSMGLPLSPRERELVSRAKDIHDLEDPARWGLLMDDAYAVAATRRRA